MKPTLRKSPATLLALLGLLACGDDAGIGGPASVELGTGTVDFESLSPDQELELVAGPQGGYHFIVHARMVGLEPGDPSRPGLPDNPRTSFGIHDESGTRLSPALPPYRLGYLEDEGGAHILPSGRILQIDDELVRAGRVPDLFGQRLRLTVELTDARGSTATDERWIVAALGGAAPGGDAGPGPDAGPVPDAGP